MFSTVMFLLLFPSGRSEMHFGNINFHLGKQEKEGRDLIRAGMDFSEVVRLLGHDYYVCSTLHSCYQHYPAYGIFIDYNGSYKVRSIHKQGSRGVQERCLTQTEAGQGQLVKDD
jgi:hypothetical protein